MYSQTSLTRTPKGQNKGEQVSALQRCPYYRDVRKERLDCICFLNKFLLADFLTFSGKAFHSRMPNQENEFFSVVQDEKT